MSVPQEGFHAWNYKPGLKLLTGGITGLRRKPTVTVLLNALAIKFILNIYVYTHRFVRLSTLVREVCFAADSG